MNEIREITSKFCSNVSSDPRLLQETIRQSFKDLCSLSKQMKSLADYGPILMSKKLFEPVSPGASSPCHSDNCLDEDEEKSRVAEPSLYEVAEIFLDTSATIEISQSAQNSNWCLWIMICGLHDERLLKGLLALVEKHVPNVQYEACKKVVYKGQVSFVLHFKEHFTAQKVFTFLKEDFYAKTYIKDRWQVMRIYNRMDDPKYMSQFFGVILQNLPLDCTSQTIIDLVAMHSSNISVLSVEIPTLIGDSFCSMIRTKTLEDAEMLALTLNGLITQTGNIRAGLHPSCNFKHQNFDKDPFKDLKIVVDHHSHKTVKESKNDENKNDIKSLLSLFKNELKTRKTTAIVEAPKILDNSIPLNEEGQRMMPFAPQQFPPNFFESRPGFAFRGPPSAPHPQQVFLNNPRYPPAFFPYPQKWGPQDFRNFRPDADYYHPSAEFPRIQRFGKKIQKTWIKPTRPLNNKNNSKKKQLKPNETNAHKDKEISQFPSPQPVLRQEESKKELPVSPSPANTKRSFVDSVQNGNKQNLEKIFDKKLADWNIGVYQVKSALIVEKKPEASQGKPPTRINQDTWSVSSWKITSGKNSNASNNNNNKLPSYLENMMDQMINPSSKSVTFKRPSRFSDEPGSINEKRRLESLYPEKDENSDKIQKLKTNIQEFQKKSSEVEDHNGRFKIIHNKHDSLSLSSDEEAELNLGPQKKQYLETFTTGIPSCGELLKQPPEESQRTGEKKINFDSLGWSIKCNPLPQKEQKEKKDVNPSPGASHENPKKDISPPTTGATNIVFNGPYVQSSNLNCMYLPPGMTYPHLLMNMNHQQPPLAPNSFSFNPQMMVYHNNFILNPLVHQPSFWNIPVSNAPLQQEGAKKTNSPKKLKDWNPPSQPKENLIPAKHKVNEECPEPESTPPVLPGIEHCD